MPKITIVRPYEWYNQGKKMSIYIDDKKVGSVGIDKTVQFDVSPGKHTVFIGNKWLGGSKTIEFDLSDNERKTIKMSSFKYTWLIVVSGGFVGAFMNTFYLFLKNLFNLESTISFGVFSLLVIIIFISIVLLIFRKHTLKLEVVEGERV